MGASWSPVGRRRCLRERIRRAAHSPAPSGRGTGGGGSAAGRFRHGVDVRLRRPVPLSLTLAMGGGEIPCGHALRSIPGPRGAGRTPNTHSNPGRSKDWHQFWVATWWSNPRQPAPRPSYGTLYSEKMDVNPLVKSIGSAYLFFFVVFVLCFVGIDFWCTV